MSDKWTTDNIPNLDGKTFLITGANTGLGFGSAHAIAHKGGQVVMAVRTLEKGETAAAKIKAATPNAQVDVMRLDLADLESVADFTENFSTRYERLDVLMNNAGVMMVPERQETQQGYELQLGTNHFGPFALTGRLLHMLAKTPGARVVTLSSSFANRGKMNWEDLNSEQSYNRFDAYGQSKLANLLFMLELDDRLKAAGLNIKSTAAHPGYTATDLQRHLGFLGAILNKIFAQSIPMGILPQLRATFDTTLAGGEYYGPNGFMEMRGYPTLADIPATAQDKAAQARLWALSEEATQVSYTLETA